MKTILLLPCLCLLACLSLHAQEEEQVVAAISDVSIAPPAPLKDDNLVVQPVLLRLTAKVDGSGKIVFTRDSMRYEHKFWRSLQTSPSRACRGPS